MVLLEWFTVPSWYFICKDTVPSRYFLCDGTVPSRYFLRSGTVPSRYFLRGGTVHSPYHHLNYKWRELTNEIITNRDKQTAQDSSVKWLSCLKWNVKYCFWTHYRSCQAISYISFNHNFNKLFKVKSSITIFVSSIDQHHHLLLR